MLYRAFLLMLCTVTLMMVTAIIVLGLPFKLVFIDTFYSNYGITPYDMWQFLFILEFFAFMVASVLWVPGLIDKVLNWD